MPTIRDAAEEARKRLAEKLKKGEKVTIRSNGEVEADGKSGDGIEIPKGKLAYQWYDNDPDLLQEEKLAMARFFPKFKMEKLEDGRLFWHGAVKTKVLNPDNEWYLQVIYQNNHPDNSTYGGSIRVYSVDPDLEELAAEVGGIPHMLRDENNHVFICTARQTDFLASPEESSSAASAIAWAVKWITVFELWLDSKVTTEEFQSHTF
ncbi:hypothetical protein PbJCM13498_33450 [Prolixibacter bellariivorans]|uniref:Type II CBASS E2 protein domain-containing protein n=1 Tax=Prolixibacter bellariivorans TaxID=314319 RepID=A0A5M4B2Y7_9BACT|nr:hypothetical protein [Prolixibacter bellariivorans]GET34482.1 hypothetical protein PbJCM13498_33450 [Prolixibacter bellariivorans]